MKVTLLGTGTSQGVPVIGCNCEVCTSEDPKDKRLRSSVMIEEAGKVIVIDTGPDFRQQMLNAGNRQLDAVIYTHEHRDHVAGLDEVRSFNFLQQMPVDVYAEERVHRALMREFSYIFAERKYPGVPQINYHEITSHPFDIGELKIIPVRVLHHRLPVLGFRIGDFSYITDASYISEDEKEKLIGTKYLVINGLRKEPHISHFTLDQALDIIRELSPKRAFITHISHRLGRHADVEKILPFHIRPGYDGLTFEL